MIRHIAFLICLLSLMATSAHAGTAEARDAARQNNCPPKKIEVYQDQLGSEGQVIYQVTCNLPKTTEKDSKGGPDALLITCNQSLCELLRPISLEKK